MCRCVYIGTPELPRRSSARLREHPQADTDAEPYRERQQQRVDPPAAEADEDDGKVKKPYFVGTRAFRSSNQFSTTCICELVDGPAAVEPAAPATMTATNFWPSAGTSLRRATSPAPSNHKRGFGIGTGLPKARVGCVVTATARSRTMPPIM